MEVDGLIRRWVGQSIYVGQGGLTYAIHDESMKVA